MFYRLFDTRFIDGFSRDKIKLGNKKNYELLLALSKKLYFNIADVKNNEN